MSQIKAWGVKLGRVLVLHGGWGLLGMSFLDSSFVPFPVVNDLALILLASKHPSRAPLYALASTLGSVLGVYVLYGLARGGSHFLWRKTAPAAILRAKHWLARNDFLALLVASLLPPPTPLKAFIVAAGALRVNALRFGAAMLLGRGLRFGVEGWMGARYGPSAQDYLKRNWGWASLAIVVVIVVLALLRRAWSSRHAERSTDSSTPQSGAV